MSSTAPSTAPSPLTATDDASKPNDDRAKQAAKAKRQRTLPEELFDKTVTYIDGPLNARAERVMKSRLVLAPIGLGLLVGSRVALAAKERRVSSLWRSLS